MNVTKKVLCIFCSMIVMVSACLPAQAQSNNQLNVYFDEFFFSTSDYGSRNVTVQYANEEDTEIATILDADTAEVLEVMMVVPQEATTRGVYPYTYIRKSTVGDTELQLSINVELYNEGSFRQINSIEGYYLGINTTSCGSYLEGQNVNVWPKNHILPSIQLFYAYNGTLAVEIDTTLESSLEVELPGFGYSFSHSIGLYNYYRQTFNRSGTINLY